MTSPREPVSAGMYYPDAQEAQLAADVSVVIPTVLRPALLDALDSIFAQTFSGRMQILAGVDVAKGPAEALRAKLEQRPEQRPEDVSAIVLTLPHSTSTRNGGLHLARGPTHTPAGAERHRVHRRQAGSAERMALFPRVLLFFGMAALLSACASIGVGPQSPPDDPPVREFTTEQAIALINAHRASVGVAPVVEDTALDAQAVQLASRFALLGEQTEPPGLEGVLYVSGGKTFEESLAALRSNANGAAVMAKLRARRAGVGSVSLDGATAYWVVLLD